MALEREIWAMSDDELVPTSLLIVSVKCGAIVIGAFDGPEMIGFVYSFPGDRHGTRLQWSHMLGVLPGYRGTGVGHRLKLLQRERSLAQGVELVEWTYDPLQAPNAHFNVSKLGVVVREYIEDAYGETNSPLHRGAPTDRFVAQWWLRSTAVTRLARQYEDRFSAEARSSDAQASAPAAGWTAGRVGGQGSEVDPGGDVPVANPARREGRWWVCDEARHVPGGSAPIRVVVPPDYTAMLAQAPALALQWRLTTRRVFQAAFTRGLVVTGFLPDAAGGGHYVLTPGAH